VGIDDVKELSSVRLGSDGSFSLSGEAPTAGPEFYRLRIADQIVNLAIDSTETVVIRGQWPNLASTYEVADTGQNARIRELALMQIRLQDSVIALTRRGGISPSQLQQTVADMVERHKHDVTTRYIFTQPWSASAYFALFQTIGNSLIFNPRTDAADVRVFAAVATSWDTYHPGTARTENLHSIALEGMRQTGHRQSAAGAGQAGGREIVVETGSIDIGLKDKAGRERHLHELKGQVVMLDFHVFAQQESTERILLLQELYGKYHSRGFEIFQVSLDPDRHFWRQRTEALPWVCVRDDDALDSRYLPMYNVQSLPEFFLIDRDGNLVKRSLQIDDIDKEIQQLLR
jgi:peroxiredoxin